MNRESVVLLYLIEKMEMVAACIKTGNIDRFLATLSGARMSEQATAF